MLAQADVLQKAANGQAVTCGRLAADVERRWGRVCKFSTERQQWLDATWEDYARFSADQSQLVAWLAAANERLAQPDDVTSSEQEAEIIDWRGRLAVLNASFLQMAREGRLDAAGQLRQLHSEVNAGWDQLLGTREQKIREHKESRVEEIGEVDRRTHTVLYVLC